MCLALKKVILKNKSGQLVVLKLCRQIVCICLQRHYVRRGETPNVCTLEGGCK